MPRSGYHVAADGRWARSLAFWAAAEHDFYLVELLLVVRKPLGSAVEAALAAALTGAFGHAFPLRFTYVESIPRGTDGKLHDIQCEVPEAD
jgi:hypothetical protein